MKYKPSGVNEGYCMYSKRKGLTQKDDFYEKELAVVERYMVKTKDILLKNRDFLEKVTAALEEKETLLYSDIQKIRKDTTVTAVTV